MDKYAIDSHKLYYHVPRVNAWLNGENIYPLYMEISPTGMCNHRCTFCALDYMKYRNKSLDSNILKSRIHELAELGLKSVMFAGEGEPLLYKDFTDILLYAKKCGIDTAITTNGVLLTREISEQVLEHTEWIKISIAGATPETYSSIHRTKASDFNIVIRNMTDAVKEREKLGAKCTLGMQLLLLPENRNDVMELAKIASSSGADYLVIKPYSQHLSSKTDKYGNIKYSDYMELEEALSQFNRDDFNVIFRKDTMKAWDSKTRDYKNCLALPFWSYLDSEGNVWGCSTYLGDDRFLYGNINKTSFQDIWEGEKRRKSMEWVMSDLDTSNCRINCRMDKINSYLWSLRHLPKHVNFI